MEHQQEISGSILVLAIENTVAATKEVSILNRTLLNQKRLELDYTDIRAILPAESPAGRKAIPF